jgi:hypothetical protein
MAPTSDYHKAYEQAKTELADLLQRQLETEKRIVVVRKSLENLAALCEDGGIEIETSAEAAYLLENTNLADEIRHILVGAWPGYLKPNRVKLDLEQLGWDLTRYRNPQATIQMVMKRMAESGNVQEGVSPEDGKRLYRAVPLIPPTSRIARAFADARNKGGTGMIDRDVVRRGIQLMNRTKDERK